MVRPSKMISDEGQRNAIGFWIMAPLGLDSLLGKDYFYLYTHTFISWAVGWNCFCKDISLLGEVNELWWYHFAHHSYQRFAKPLAAGWRGASAGHGWPFLNPKIIWGIKWMTHGMKPYRRWRGWAECLEARKCEATPDEQKWLFANL